MQDNRLPRAAEMTAALLSFPERSQLGWRQDSAKVENSDTPDPADVVSGIIAREGLDRILKAMDERERKVVELRFGLKGDQPRTLADVSCRFNVSRERIRQIEAKALEQIRASDLIQAVWESA